MDIPAHQQPNQALRLLSHYAPRAVMEKARDLAPQLEREEAFRAYLLKKMWLIIPSAFLFAAFSFIIGTLLFRGALPYAPDAAWARRVLLFVAVGIALAGFLLQLYFLLSGLQRRAEREGALSRTIES